MSINVVDELSANEGSAGDQVSLDVIKKLSANLFKKLQIKEAQGSRDLDCSDPTHPKKNDTRTIYFERSKVEELFKANDKPGNPCDGLLIYLGVHDQEIFPVKHPSYYGKLMVVLATMTKNVLNLTPGSKVDIAGAKTESAVSNVIPAGQGLDNGKLCPPNPNC